jgi:large subunit ribosomal protein L18
MNELVKKRLNRILRKNRVRAKVKGTATRPRLSVTISNRYISVQLIDDEKQRTLAAATSVGLKQTNLTDQAKMVGTEIAKKAKKAKIKTIVFDRNGRKYAKRLNALADVIREIGLEF